MKYKLGQTVYYMKDNKVVSAPVLSKCRVRNDKENEAINDALKELYVPYGKAGNYYSTVDGRFLEENLFETKVDVLNTL